MKRASALALSLCALVGCSDNPAVPVDATSDVVLDAAADSPAEVDVAPEPDVPFVCTRRRGAVPWDGRCNGREALCGRAFDAVSYLTTHNAMSNATERFIAPNQTHPIARQLRDGVRGLMLDLHDDRGVVSLCHGVCSLGRRPLVEGLCAVGQHLDEDPGAVVTLILESYVPVAAMEPAFREAGLLDDVHTQALGAAWPTLGEMVRSGRRLVVLTDRDGGTRPWLHDVWDYAQETPFSAAAPSELSCRPNRGDAGNALFIFNHFLTMLSGFPHLARMVNFNPFLLERARACQAARGRLPNFVTVDFYEIGDASAAVSALNGFAD